MKFTRTHQAANRGTSTYTSEDGRKLYLPKSVGEHPETLEVDGLAPKAERPAKEAKAAKEDKEARKARLAARTPEQVAQDNKRAALDAVARANARVAKLGPAATA